MLPSSKWKLFILLTLSSYCRLVNAVVDDRQQAPHSHGADHHDPWAARDQCKQFPYPQCQCNETRVNCVNAQMTSHDMFLHVHDYPNVVSVTFRGNNFLDLPSNLFGFRDYEQLRYLNLSANYLVSVHVAAFTGMPNLVSLDLSHNEIVFDETDVDLLTLLPKLEELRLRKAFPRSMQNASQQMDLFRRMLETAKLNKLRLLDLSYNDLERLPTRLGNAAPNLETLLLIGNSFRTFDLVKASYKRLKRLDLSDNLFPRLDQNFIKFANNMPRNSISLRRNPFLCDNRSTDFMNWLRETTIVADKSSIKCQLGHDENCLRPFLSVFDNNRSRSDPGDQSGLVNAAALLCSAVGIHSLTLTGLCLSLVPFLMFTFLHNIVCF